MMPRVISINISKGGIPKRPVEAVPLFIEGFKGDGHNHEKHRTPFQAVCLQDIEKIEELSSEGYPLSVPGTTGENLTVSGLNVNQLPLGTVLRLSGGTEIELTKVRKPCYVLDVINPKLKEDIAGRCGMYAKVITEGIVRVGEEIEVVYTKSRAI